MPDKDKDKLKEAEDDADWLLEERTISYKQFDQFEKQMQKLYLEINRLDPTPVNEGTFFESGVGFARDVERIIAESDNVLPFSKPPS